MIERRRFEPSFESARAARRFVTEALGAVAADRRRDAMLMVSELATNAVRHARTAFTVTVDHSPTELRVEVTDSDVAGEPRVCSPDPSEPTGRGLRLVDQLADRWGVEVAPGGTKTVWFVVVLDPTSTSTSRSGASAGASTGASTPTSTGADAAATATADAAVERRAPAGRSSPGSGRRPSGCAPDQRALHRRGRHRATHA